MIKAGDILFYKNVAGNIVDQTIATFEKSSSAFIHCAIAVSEYQKIEALFDGIVLDQIGDNPDGIYVNTTKQNDISKSILWLYQQVGHAYGYLDLFDAFIAMHVRGIEIPDNNFDCSALSTEFLIKCGRIDLGRLAIDPHSVTPQELADKLGVK